MASLEKRADVGSASLLVTGHILRHALEWSYAAGVAAATAYFALSTLAFRSLFPVT